MARTKGNRMNDLTTERAAHAALDAEAAEKARWMAWACAGSSCKQGKRMCKSPDRCHTDDRGMQMLAYAMIGAVLMLALLAALLIVRP
jgi:hypothetical protein